MWPVPFLIVADFPAFCGSGLRRSRWVDWFRLLIFGALSVGVAGVLPAIQGFTTFYHCLFFLKPVLTWALPLFTTYEKKW